MATKIIMKNDSILFDGHSDTVEDCRTVTALCDALAASENFETVRYESGHAEFKRISGGDSEMFAALEAQVAALKEQVAALSTQVTELEARIAALEGKTEYKLPYTASELETLLNSI